MRLMAIPGKSGQEHDIVQFIRHTLLDAGAPAGAVRTDSAHRRSPSGGTTGNLALKLPGSVRAPRRLLMGHLDTVPICLGAKPVKKGNLVKSGDPATGLGADDRAGVAVVLSTALEIIEKRLPHPPLTFFWPVQEEIGLCGSRYATVRSLGGPQLAFNFDGGAPDKLTVGATGGYRCVIEVSGIASHAGGAPERGVSAIAIASLAIADLVRGGWHGNISKDGASGTSNVGTIRGGEATNVVTDRVVLKAEARSHAPRFRKRIVREIESAFRRAAKEVTNAAGRCGRVKFVGRLDYESFLLRGREPCVLEAEAAVRGIGRQPQRAVTNGGLDANWMFRHGIPTVTLGCGQIDQHTVTEGLNLKEFDDACRIALLLATDGN